MQILLRDKYRHKQPKTIQIIGWVFDIQQQLESEKADYTRFHLNAKFGVCINRTVLELLLWIRQL